MPVLLSNEKLPLIKAILVFALVGLVPETSGAAMKHSAVVSANPADYTPWLVETTAVPHPHVDAIAQVGKTIFAGGRFNRVAHPGGSPAYTRNNLVAFDAATGAVRTVIKPSFDGQVWAIEGFGSAVYVGGDFTSVDGITRKRLVKLDVATGAVDPVFNPNFAGGSVKDLQMWNGPNGSTPMLVVGGSMGKKLVALDPITGADNGYFDLGIADPIPDAWGGVAVYQFAINPAGTKLVATGNFMTVKGQSRTRLFVANLTGPSASLDPWYYPGFGKACSSTHPRRIAYLQGVDFSPDGSYFVVAATGQVPKQKGDIWPDGNTPPHTVCDAAGRFNLNDATKPVWINYTGGDSVWAVAVTGPAVYVQGHFKWLDNPNGTASNDGGGAVQRLGIGAIGPVSGKALSWAPPKPAQIGGKAFLATSEGLWVGSDSERFNKELHRGIAFVPLP